MGRVGGRGKKWLDFRTSPPPPTSPRCSHTTTTNIHIYIPPYIPRVMFCHTTTLCSLLHFIVFLDYFVLVTCHMHHTQ